jgi:phosphate butyryltransferase
MFTTFKEIETYVLSQHTKKRIALANAHDVPALSAVVNAKRKGVVEGTLIGHADAIVAMLHDMGENEADYEIVPFDGEELDAAKVAVALVREGKADIPMKGILQTSNFARAILNRETGLIPASGRRLVSQAGIFEYENRLLMITDCAINIAPDVETRIGICQNILPVAKAIGNECPKVALLSAVETLTDKMPSTVESAEIAKRGVEGCIISGPLALDGAISMESVKHKAIKNPVAGQADILIVPNIETGNSLYKSVTYIAGKTMASVVCGASCPVIITSRADTPDSKYYSVLMAVLRCIKGC